VIGQNRKFSKVGFIIRKIGPKVARRKYEAECIFSLYGMNSVKFLCSTEFATRTLKEVVFILFFQGYESGYS
jgi:hypothetical protein